MGKAIIVELEWKNAQESRKKLIAKIFPREHAQKRVFQNGGHGGRSKFPTSPLMVVEACMRALKKGIDAHNTNPR